MIGSISSDAFALVVVPPLLITSARNCHPFSVPFVAIAVIVAVVTLAKLALAVKLLNDDPLFVETCHWKVGAGVPVATTANVAFAPISTVAFDGCVVITGGTSSVAFALVFDPTVFVATARKRFVFCAAVTPITVSVEFVFPENPLPFVTLLKLVPPFVETCHCNVGAGFPVVTTVNVAFDPTTVVEFDGGVENPGAKFTVRFATLLVVVPPALIASTWNSHPFIAAVVGFTIIVCVCCPVKVVFPAVMLLNVPPLFVESCHWKLVAPVAVDVKVAPVPAVAVWFVGCVVNTGCPNAAPAAPVKNSASARSRRAPRPPVVNPLRRYKSFFMG
jgi:hypothetical protein